jgi:hypothetical protein
VARPATISASSGSRVVDEVAEQRQLVVGHRLRGRTRERAWHRDVGAGPELVQPPPAVDRQEAVVRRGTKAATQPRAHREDGLAAGAEGIRHTARLELPRLRVERRYPEVAHAGELVDPPVLAGVR